MTAPAASSASSAPAPVDAVASELDLTDEAFALPNVNAAARKLVHLAL